MAPLFRPGTELDDINRGAQEAEYEDLDMYRGDYSQVTDDEVHFPPFPPATLLPRVSSTRSPPAEYDYPITKDSGGVKETDYTQCAAYAIKSGQGQTEESDHHGNVGVLSADLESSVQYENPV